MKRDEMNRLLDDLLDGELNDEGMALLNTAREEDPQFSTEADQMDALEANLQAHLKPIREAKAPERDYATRIVSRLRMEKEAARQDKESKGVVPWFGARLASVAGYTFIVCLFSVLATMQFVVPPFAEQGARIIAAAEAEGEQEIADAKAHAQEISDQINDLYERAKLDTAPDAIMPELKLDTAVLVENARLENDEPLFSDRDESMEQPYYKADTKMFSDLWGIDPEEVPADESEEEAGESE